MELPEYYKTVIFCDMNGKEHRGYLEPPFGNGDEDCFFFEEDVIVFNIYTSINI